MATIIGYVGLALGVVIVSSVAMTIMDLTLPQDWDDDE